MKILVTGGGGFLGSHLCSRLLTLGHYVIAVDNFYTGDPHNIDKIKTDPNFELIQHDVNFPIYLEIDGIFNLACPASPVHYQRDPVQTLKTSVYGATNLLELAKRTGARILQASTSEVYGDPEIHPQHESYWGRVNPIGVRACYDEGKRAAETLFSDYHRQYGTDIRIARIFNTFGPKMAINDGRVVGNLIVQALQKKELTIFGDGNQTRSFCYVEDLIEGLVSLFFTENIYEPVNLGNPESVSIKQLASEILQLTSSESTLVYKDLPLDDPKDRQPDIRRALELLRWKPKISRIDGLKKTIDYFNDLLKDNLKSR